MTAETAVACAKAVADLEAAKTLDVGAKIGDHDTPALNRIEGAVLLLMIAVFRAVDGARAAGKTRLVLKPRAATRRVIAPNARVRTKEGGDQQQIPRRPEHQPTASAKVRKGRRKKR